MDEKGNQSKPRSIPYEQYFGDMELTAEQKAERQSLAEKLEAVMLFLFELYGLQRDFAYGNAENIVEEVKTRYKGILSGYTTIDKYLDDYIDAFSAETVKITIQNEKDKYYTSNDRAVYVAENEANTNFEYIDFQKAKKAGKTKKQWATMRDKRVRHTHAELEGVTIPIDETFLVGNGIMAYPKDSSFDAPAEEIVNCRCTLKYI